MVINEVLALVQGSQAGTEEPSTVWLQHAPDWYLARVQMSGLKLGLAVLLEKVMDWKPLPCCAATLTNPRNRNNPTPPQLAGE